MFMFVLSFYLYSLAVEDGCWNGKHLTTEQCMSIIIPFKSIECLEKCLVKNH